MTPHFFKLIDALEKETAGLRTDRRALFLLAYADRFADLFRLFEMRTALKTGTYEDIVRAMWKAAVTDARDREIAALLDHVIPGEEWVVDGFHDALAQYIGGLARGAIEGLYEHSVTGFPESAVFAALRLVLCEMRLGCTEPGSEAPADREFEEKLHTEPLVTEELAFWRELMALISREDRRISADEVRVFVASRRFDVARLEPELSAGLSRDHAAATEWLQTR